MKAIWPGAARLLFFYRHAGEGVKMGDLYLWLLIGMLVAYAFWDELFTE